MKYTIIPFLFVVLWGFQSCQTSHKNDEITMLRKQHQQFLDNSPFAKSLLLNKQERKAMGIPPNPYLERQWELTMNPRLGRPTPEKLIALQKQLSIEHQQTRNVPGNTDNPWISRGPTNVGGRSKAVLFDPNDPTHKRVFAGSVSGGLWVNNDITNSNSAWQLTGLPDNLAVTSISVDPNNSQVFYVGTGESYTGGAVVGNGVWKSSDGGTTWTHVFGGQDGTAQFVSNATLTVNTPVNMQGDMPAVKSAFGDTDFTSVSGNLVLTNDGSSDPTLACNPLTNAAAVNGNIAVIERGTCYFVDKVKNAQNAGAIAVLMINNVDGTPIIMGGTDNTITIPSVMISKAEGQAIFTALNAGTQINVTIQNNNTDIAMGYFVPGITQINDIVTRNNNGTTEIYVAAGDGYFSDAYPYTVLSHGYQGVYKSTDGGATWQQVNLPLDPAGNPFTPNDLEIAADNGIWLTTTRSTVFGTDQGAILSSTDGNAFNVVLPVTNVGRMELAVSKSDAGKMYLAVIQYSSSGSTPLLLKTTDGFTADINTMSLPVGDSTPSNDFTNGQGYYDLAIEVDPNNDNVVYVGGIDWFKTTNSGSSWTQITTGYGWVGSSLHPDQHGIAFADSQHIVFANDGGIAYSSNGGAVVSARNVNYVTAQFYHMAAGPTTAFTGDYFMAGAQDNGTQLFENAPQSPTFSIEAQGGDGAFCFFDQDGTDKYRISNYVYNARIRLYNYNTGTWKTVNQESDSKGDFINQEALDSHLNILYSNYSSRTSTGSTYAIRRYANLLGTISKASIQDPMMNSFPTALKVSPFTTNASKLFVGLQNGKLLRVDNAHASTYTFTDITGSDFLGSISDIEFGQTENDIFVTISNYGVNSIYYSNDGGNTWQNKEGNLPDVPVNCILQNPLNTDEVIIGTDLGVWKTQHFYDTNVGWVHSYNGMSNVKVTDMQLRDDHMVFAATYGRGIFSAPFDSTVKVENIDKLTFTIYPNPAHDFVNIVWPENVNLDKAKLIIYDMAGKKVLKKTLKKQDLTLNINDLSTGNYIVNLKIDHKIYSVKLIKE